MAIPVESHSAESATSPLATSPCGWPPAASPPCSGYCRAPASPDPLPYQSARKRKIPGGWGKIPIKKSSPSYRKTLDSMVGSPPCIVAATVMLQMSTFPQPSGLKVVEISRLFHLHYRARVSKTQASRCYECHPVTSRCPLTKFRAAGCALFQNESSDVVWSRQTDFLY
jgi:hypothetical protein